MSEIPKKMKAVMAYAPGDYRLEDVDVPTIDEYEMLAKVEACGICAGDLKAYHGAASFWGLDGQAKYIKEPMIPGHEFIARLVAVGSKVKDFKVGDRVISEQIVPCWECKFCKTGRYWMCQKHDVYGFQNNVNGGMAEYIKFNKEAIVHPVPEDLAMEKAILIEPYACSKHCVDRGQIKNDDVVVLSGVGTLGLGMIGCIKQCNPDKFIVLDMLDDRLDLAKKFGADVVMNPSKEDVVQKILDMTDGYGCDVYIEATGHPSSVIQGLDMIRKLGRFVEFSVFKDPTTVDWSIISDRKELDVLGAHLSPYCYPIVTKWIQSGILKTDNVVSHKVALTDWKKAFDIAEKTSECLKVILIP